MTRQLRHSPAKCYIGDFFPVPVDAGDTLIWFYLPPIPCEIPLNADWPPRWEFHRAAWRSDSGPFVIDVFLRKR